MKLSSRIDFLAARNGLELERGERVGLGLPVYNLSQSNPTRAGFAWEPGDLAAAFAAEGNRFYSPDPKGLASARKAIADSLAASGRPADPERRLLCASTSEAYSYLFKLLCDPGDAVLVPRPGYPLFDHLAALESVRAAGYRLEYNHPRGWSIDLASLEELLDGPDGERARAIILINPNNPTGSYVHGDELAAITELCRERGLAIIADEVFHDFSLEPREGRVSLLGKDEVLTFVLDGFSKKLCLPQAKLGWITVSGPGDEAAAALSALELISDAFLSAGTAAMNAAPALLEREREVLASMRERMAADLAAYREVLEYPGSPHRVLACEGGWTALVQSPRFAPEEDLARGLLHEEGIYVHPGFFFDMEKEAYFAFSLIVPPWEAKAAAQKYKAYFDRFLERIR